jgi:hypothetical protein
MPELHGVVSSVEGVVARSLGQDEQLSFFARLMLNIDSPVLYPHHKKYTNAMHSDLAS